MKFHRERISYKLFGTLRLIILCNNLCGKHIKVLSVHIAAVAYFNEMRGKRITKFNSITKKIWLGCKDKSIWIKAVHIPGVDKAVADKLPLTKIPIKGWMLNSKVFEEIVAVLGCPTVNLFAPRHNDGVPLYLMKTRCACFCD